MKRLCMKGVGLVILVSLELTSLAVWAADNKSIGVKDQVIVSTNRDTVIYHEWFNYAPSVMKDPPTTCQTCEWVGNCRTRGGDCEYVCNSYDCTKYRMWWTGYSPGDPNEWMGTIYYAESTNGGFSWTTPAGVMHHGAIEDVADPSIIKVGSTYYMYFSGSNFTTPPCAGNGEIYLATSTDGQNWTKYPSNQSPQPMIRNDHMDCSYGVGQPSVAYRNGRFEMFFTDTSHPNGIGVYFATSSDGYYWTRQNGGNRVINTTPGGKIHYCPSRNRYFLFRSEERRIGVHVSNDGTGVNWDPYPFDSSKFLHLNPQHLTWWKEMTGAIVDQVGMMEANTAVFYGTGPFGNEDRKSWNYIERVDVSLEPLVSNAAYRYYSDVAKDHFYKQDPNSPDYYWYVGVGFRIFTSQVSGTVPFHHLYKTDITKHMYTASVSEKNYLVSIGWTYVGTLGYIATNQLPNTVPLYRLYHPTVGEHLFTLSWAEASNAMSQLGFVYEGIAGYEPVQ